MLDNEWLNCCKAHSLGDVIVVRITEVHDFGAFGVVGERCCVFFDLLQLNAAAYMPVQYPKVGESVVAYVLAHNHQTRIIYATMRERVKTMRSEWYELKGSLPIGTLCKAKVTHIGFDIWTGLEGCWLWVGKNFSARLLDGADTGGVCYVDQCLDVSVADYDDINCQILVRRVPREINGD